MKKQNLLNEINNNILEIEKEILRLQKRVSFSELIVYLIRHEKDLKKIEAHYDRWKNEK